MGQIPPPTSSKPGKSAVTGVVRTLYTYTAQGEGELSFEEGQTLYLLSSNSTDKNWILCKLGDKTGLVPANYVGENVAQIDNPLHEAAKRGNIAFAKELIEAKISMNGFDKAKNAPIHWACRNGHIEIVKMLLAQNVVLSSQNKLGDTPLHLAAWGGHVEIVKLLLLAGGTQNLKIKNSAGETPLKLAKDTVTAALLMAHAGSPTNADRLGGNDEDSD